MKEKKHATDMELRLSPGEFREFIDVCGAIGAAEIVHSGARFVDSRLYWQWMAESYPGVMERYGSWRAYIEAHPSSSITLFKGKTFEWDWVRAARDQPSNILKSVKLSAENNARIDAVEKTLFGGDAVGVEIKYASSPASARSSVRNALEKPGMGKLVGTPEIVDEANRRASDHSLVVEEFTDSATGESAAKQRMEQARAGQTVAGINARAVVGQAARGALVGGIVCAGGSAIVNFRAWKRGQITGEEFGRSVAHESAKGAVKGTIIGGANVGVQVGAAALGVGVPVTIPVMICSSFAVDKIVNPDFGDGEYRKILEKLEFSSQLARLHVGFAISCEGAFDAISELAEAQHELSREAAEIRQLGKSIDAEIEDVLRKI